MINFVAPPALTPMDLLALAEDSPHFSEQIVAAAQQMETDGIEKLRYVGFVQSPFTSTGINPRGMEVTIPKGTKLYGVFTKSTKNVVREPGKRPYVVAGRTYKVKIEHHLSGSINPIDFNFAKGAVVVNPSVR